MVPPRSSLTQGLCVYRFGEKHRQFNNIFNYHMLIGGNFYKWILLLKGHQKEGSSLTKIEPFRFIWIYHCFCACKYQISQIAFY